MYSNNFQNNLINFCKKQNILSIDAVILRSYARSALFSLFSAIVKVTQKNEVLLPAFCCEAVYLAAYFSKMKIKLIDVSKKNFSLSLKSLRSNISENTAAILVPHMFGICPYSEKLDNVKNEFSSIIWIDDACQSFLNDSQNNIKEGTNFDFGLYSFDETKPLFGSIGLLAINNLNKRNSNIFEFTKLSGREIEKSIVTELSRAQESYFKFLISLRRNGLDISAKKNNIIGFYSLYLDNSKPNFFETEKSLKGLKSVFDLSYGIDNINLLANKLNKEFSKNIKVYVPSDNEKLWRLPIIIKNKNLTSKLSYYLRMNNINVSNHYYSLASLFNQNIDTCSVSIDLSDKIINVWLEKGQSIEKVLNAFREFFKNKRL